MGREFSFASQGTWQTRLALAGITVLALALRLWVIDWQLPWQFHPDEGHYVWKAAGMGEDGNLNPKYFRNPSFYTYLLFVEYRVMELLPFSLESLAPAWEALRQPSLPVLLGRVTSAVLGAATVVVVYRLGAELLGRAAGLIGALLLAVSFLHVRDSHFATNDVPATFFLMVSALFSAFLARTGHARDALLAGFFGGLATSTKYNAGFFVVPLLVGYVIAHRRRAVDPRKLVVLAAAGLVSVVAYLAGTPFTVLAWQTFRDDFLTQQRFAREGWEGQGSEPVWLLYLTTLGQGLGWVTFILAAVGFGLLVRRRSPAALLLGSFPLAYLVFILNVKLFFARFAIPLLPFLCLAAGYALMQAPRLRVSRVSVIAALLAVAAYQPLYNDYYHARILQERDTRADAYYWLEQNVPAGARIIAEEYTVRDRRPRAYLPDRARFDLDVVNSLAEHDLEYYRQSGYRYAITSSFQSLRFPGNTHLELRRQRRMLQEFEPFFLDVVPGGPYSPATDRFDIEELYSPFHDLGRYERPGPTIRIYSL